MKTYLDTSALLKWYIVGQESERFTDWMTKQDDTHISQLTITEFRCMLSKRERTRDLVGVSAQQIFSTFEHDIEQGFLILHEVNNEEVTAAHQMIERLANMPLRTLDAMHLAIAERIQAEAIASADKVMLNSTEFLGMKAISFVPA